MAEAAKLLDKFDAARAVRSGIGSDARNPTAIVFERLVSATEAELDGRRVILAGTNNYLGLTFDRSCIEAGKLALEREGTGTTGSRMANGTFAGHKALERELADFFKTAYAMVFSTGYAANLGTLTALLGPHDAALLDSDAHASLYDGCLMSGADVFRFRHNDVAAVDKRLERLSNRAGRCLVITEGMFSVLGDCAPLAELVEVKNRHGACLLVDEAHSVGVFGERGCGVAEAQGVSDAVDFIVGTFSKSLGAMGGYCVSSHPELALVPYVSRPYIFTASLSPSSIATTRAALHQLRTRPGLRQSLWRNAERLYGGLQALGFQLGPQVSPVIGIRLDSKEEALACWNRLLEAGIYTNLMVPPASPDRHSYLRCSVSAAHSAEQIGSIIDAFRTL